MRKYGYLFILLIFIGIVLVGFLVYRAIQSDKQFNKAPISDNILTL